MTVFLFVVETHSWRQVAVTSLAQAEAAIERSTGRLVAVDPQSGLIVAATRRGDIGQPHPQP